MHMSHARYKVRRAGFTQPHGNQRSKLVEKMESQPRKDIAPRQQLVGRGAGFTLIEILMVVGIIGLLMSFLLVGVRPAQIQARDARRIADLRQVQTALELYFAKNGIYPLSPTWANLMDDLRNAGIGVSNIPNDPRPGNSYLYASDGDIYVLGAVLEDKGSPVLANDIDVNPVSGGFNCADPPNSTVPVYCVQL